MRSFHPIRLAVNLCLIVAMTIQPVSVCSASDGRQGCSKSKIASERCCCCVQPDIAQSKPKSAAPKKSCCSGKPSQADSHGSCHSAETESLSIASARDAVGSACLCDHSTRPVPDPSPRRSSNENRDTPSVLPGIDFGSSPDALDASLATYQCEPTAFSHHHVQVVFCVWRL